MIAYLQAMTDNVDDPQKVRDNVLQVALDYLAVGIDPQKTTFFIQSLIHNCRTHNFIFKFSYGKSSETKSNR